VLQARLFSYADSQRHRLGTNYQKIAANQLLRADNHFMAVNGNYGSKPNNPSSFKPVTTPATWTPTEEHWTGKRI